MTVSEAETTGFVALAGVVQEALTKRVISLPSSYHGAKVRIKVVLRAQLPSGQKDHAQAVNLVRPDKEPGKDPPPPRPKHLTWWREAAPKIPLWDVLSTDVNSYLGGGKVDGVAVSVPVVSWDPSDLGAKRVNMVATSVLEVVPR